MNDIELMKAVLTIVHGLETLTPGDLELWREQCLAQLTNEASRNFVNLAADYVKGVVEIKRDIHAMECRPIPEEIEELYPLVMEALRNEGAVYHNIYCDEFAAAAFYSIGIAHGIRKERQRRHKR